MDPLYLRKLRIDRQVQQQLKNLQKQANASATSSASNSAPTETAPEKMNNQANELVKNIRDEVMTPKRPRKYNYIASIERSEYVKKMMNLPRTLPELLIQLQKPELVKPFENVINQQIPRPDGFKEPVKNEQQNQNPNSNNNQNKGEENIKRPVAEGFKEALHNEVNKQNVIQANKPLPQPAQPQTQPQQPLPPQVQPQQPLPPQVQPQQPLPPQVQPQQPLPPQVQPQQPLPPQAQPQQPLPPQVQPQQPLPPQVQPQQPLPPQVQPQQPLPPQVQPQQPLPPQVQSQQPLPPQVQPQQPLPPQVQPQQPLPPQVQPQQPLPPQVQPQQPLPPQVQPQQPLPPQVQPQQPLPPQVQPQQPLPPQVQPQQPLPPQVQPQQPLPPQVQPQQPLPPQVQPQQPLPPQVQPQQPLPPQVQPQQPLPPQVQPQQPLPPQVQPQQPLPPQVQPQQPLPPQVQPQQPLPPNNIGIRPDVPPPPVHRPENFRPDAPRPFEPQPFMPQQNGLPPQALQGYIAQNVPNEHNHRPLPPKHEPPHHRPPEHNPSSEVGKVVDRTIEANSAQAALYAQLSMNDINNPTLSQMRQRLTDDAFELLFTGMLNLNDLSNALKNSGKDARSKLILAMANASKQGVDNSQISSSLKLITESMAIDENNPASILKNIIALYLPWYPLQEGVGFNLKIDTMPNSADFSSILKVFIQTRNYGNVNGSLILMNQNNVDMNIQCDEIFPKDDLLERMKDVTVNHTMQSNITVEQQAQYAREVENSEAKVNLSATYDLNPFLLLLAHSFIKNTIIIDGSAQA